MMANLYIVNPTDADWTRQRFVLWMGPAFAADFYLVWANHLEDALDEMIDYAEEHGTSCSLYTPEEDAEHWAEALKEAGGDEERAWELVDVDVTTAGNYGRRLPSEEWGIWAEDPDRKALKDLVARIEDSVNGRVVAPS